MSLSKQNILIVEDDLLFAENLRAILGDNKKFGEIFVKNNIEDLFSFLKEDEEINVVLLDIKLPSFRDIKSGIECIPVILDKYNSVKILMITVFNDDEKIFSSLKAGAKGYLLKGESDDRIIRSINEVAEGGGAFSPGSAAKIVEFFDSSRITGPRLTDPEIEALKLFSDGYTKKEIAKKLFKSVHTIDSHIRHIYEKLHVNSKAAAVKTAIKKGLI